LKLLQRNVAWCDKWLGEVAAGTYIYTLLIKCHGRELRARSCSLMATHRLYI